MEIKMSKAPRADKGTVCPFHKKDVSMVCHKCPLYVQVRGMNPNTGAEIDHWKCSLAWMPILMIENAQMQRQTGAAIESFRNEAVKTEGERNGMLQQIIEGRRMIR